MKVLLFVTFGLLMSVTTIAQKTITINAAEKHQTIYGFGASDAWNMNYVGRFWSNDVKEALAKYLFSQELSNTGKATGIGLSRWRFNIGAGSEEQGVNSNIEAEERRAGCFLTSAGTYNWTKQSGQQWFLRKAKEYGTENLVAFVNSPPRFFTINGRTNSDNKDRYGGTNLKPDHYDDYANFLADVLEHFKNEGLEFSQISPVNEPQFEWNSGQEGSPWNNIEIKKVAIELNKAISAKKLDTKILIAEAASFDDLHMVHDDPNKSDQIWKFFNKNRDEYIGDLSQMLPGIGGHSYWTDGDDATIRSTRENIKREATEQGNIELYQTEYNLLSKNYPDKYTNSLFLAKMIHADLAIANVCIWDYWTVVERERWNHNNRFYLIRLQPNGGDYAPIDKGGNISVDKNLWMLGHYSLFIRPNYQRISLSNANDLNGLMGSAYMAPDSSRVVLVYVNWGTTSTTINTSIINLPEGRSIDKVTPYLTDATHDFENLSPVDINKNYTIGAKSVTTVVIDLKEKNVGISKNQEPFIKIFPNPTTDKVNLHLSKEDCRNANYQLQDSRGTPLQSGLLETITSISLIKYPAASYLLKYNVDNYVTTTKIIKM